MTRNERIARMESILAAAQKDKRMLTDAETKEFDGHKQAIEVENTGDAVRELDQQRHLPAADGLRAWSDEHLLAGIEGRDPAHEDAPDRLFHRARLCAQRGV